VFWVPNYFFSFKKFDKLYDTFLSPLHFTITKTLKKPHSTTDSHHTSRQKHREWKEGPRSGRWWRVTLHVQTCSGRNRIIPLMRRPNTDSATNMPATLPRNPFDMLRGHESRPHCHDTMLRYAVTLQVCNHLKGSCSAFEKTTERLALDLSAHTRILLLYKRTIPSNIYLHCY
jgi:hypothetical protein